MGDFAGVLETRREALKMYEEIVARNPDSTPDLRGLALALARMGSITLHEGQLVESLKHYKRALDIDTRIYLTDPANVQYQLSKGWAHNNFGLILKRLSRHGDALEQFETARPYFERVAKADARDVRSRTLLETNRIRTAQTLLALGKPREALALAETALKDREELAIQNRSNAGAQGEVAEAHLAVGQIFAAMNKPTKAREHYHIAQRMFEDLIRSARSNAAMKEDLIEVEKAIKALGAPGRPATATGSNSN